MSTAEIDKSDIDESAVQHKPAFINQVQLRNYKSIHFCDVSLEPLTIFVGQNGSGKSNFLDALGFLTDLMDSRVSHAVYRRKGWKNIHSAHASSDNLTLKLHFQYSSAGYPFGGDYHLRLSSDKDSATISEERLSISKYRPGDDSFGYTYENEQIHWFGLKHTFSSGPGEQMIWPNSSDRSSAFPDRVTLGLCSTQPFSDITENLRSSSQYAFLVPKIRELYETDYNTFLKPDGSNLAHAIKALQEISPESFDRVCQFFGNIVPNIQKVEAVDFDIYETIRFTTLLSNQQPHDFYASSMSDGTLRALATLVAAYQIALPGEQGFIGIEEPETSLHPAAMHTLVDALDEATLQKQILITTHSADLLDNPTIQPKNIRVVKIIDGKTWIGPIDEASQEIIHRGLSTIGELHRQHRLDIDEDDLERQMQLAKQAEVVSA